MPSDQPARLTKKQKKATAFRERTGKGKGKLNPLPGRLRTHGDDDDDDDANAVPAMEDQALVGDAGDAARDTEGDEGRVKSSKAASLNAGETTKKRRRREDGEAAQPVAKRARSSKKISTPVDDEDDETRAGVKEPETRSEGGKQRFILFVGMSAHFSCTLNIQKTERLVSKETSSIPPRARPSKATFLSAVHLLPYPRQDPPPSNLREHTQTRLRRCACSRQKLRAPARQSPSLRVAPSSSSQRGLRYRPRSVCTSRSLTGGGSTSNLPRVVVGREIHG
jgi:hypothetical protein